jgi:diguanylate cyclase (GGDEF)-like protein
VAYIDLDGLAAINAAHGLEIGNLVVMEVGHRLTHAMREREHIAHIGGDEFAVILGNLPTPDAYQTPVKRLLEAVAAPMTLSGLNLNATASIGITLYPQGDKVDAEQLLRQADQAMYLAKLAGKNRHHVFDPVNDESTRERFLRIDEIRQGLLRSEFVLFYQPKVNLISGAVVGFEALIRWQHPTQGLLAPAKFIPTLDKHPMAITLGDWVIEAALAQLAQWNAQGIHTAVSVNIDSLQLHDPDFAVRLQRQLGAQPTVQANQLELEILETGALENMAHVSALINQLQTIGFECALDDFGTGYSSLTFLKQLTAHTIKIDQSFVRGMLDDDEHSAIVNSVLDLARNFDRQALAEGVETEAHGVALIECGCELAQGYAIARPMPSADVPLWLAQWHLPTLWAQAHAGGL